MRIDARRPDQEQRWISAPIDRPATRVMCWVALDRAIRLAPLLGDGVHLDRWEQARDRVRTAVLTNAWSEKTGAYAGSFGSDDLDASVSLLPLVGFLPAEDARMWATIRAIERELGDQRPGPAGQAFSHVGLINAAWRVTQATNDKKKGTP